MPSEGRNDQTRESIGQKWREFEEELTRHGYELLLTDRIGEPDNEWVNLADWRTDHLYAVPGPDRSEAADRQEAERSNRSTTT